MRARLVVLALVAGAAGHDVSLVRRSLPELGLALDVVARGPGLGAPFRSVAPGYGIARLSATELARERRAHPELHVQTMPRLRLASDRALPRIGVPDVERSAGLTGRDVMVGVIDSGFDVTHPALRDPSGATRFLWLLDYTRAVRGKHAEMEAEYALDGCADRAEDGTDTKIGGACVVSDSCADPSPCKVSLGAIYSGAEINALLRADAPAEPLPTDEEGHGTHAMSIVAGTALPSTPYRGVASEAGMIGVKADAAGFSVSSSAVLAGARFVFDRAGDAKAPVALNLSLSGGFLVRDAGDDFAGALVEMTRRPGRVIVAAAGNTGEPTLGVHQTVSVNPDGAVRVGLRRARGNEESLQVIVSPHPGADVRVGCDAGEGRWVLPIGRGQTRSAVLRGSAANVIFDPAVVPSILPAESVSALVIMNGPVAGEPTSIVLEGRGTVDLWAAGGNFDHGVREQTVGSPANHPEIIAVGASVTRDRYRTLAGEELVVRATAYDPGGLIALPDPVAPVMGQVANFSSAGPGVFGTVKPDLLAPGVLIVDARTAQDPESNLFADASFCPPLGDGVPSPDPRCLWVDGQHGAASGTSFAAPFVTGAAALLLQADPTLTQEEARIALQAGVHTTPGARRFYESSSVGELDVRGSLAVARRLRNPVSVLPSTRGDRCWITPSSHYVLADGTRPLEVLIHLRSDGDEPADGFDRDRFDVYVLVDGARAPLHRLERRGPGLWAATFEPTRDWILHTVAIHATFDGKEIAAPIPLQAALDPWQASYPSTARGSSCGLGGSSRGAPPMTTFLVPLVLLALGARRRTRSLSNSRPCRCCCGRC